jgi:2,3-diketo-5-methylthiopentyl-1-phosphate enolase
MAGKEVEGSVVAAYQVVAPEDTAIDGLARSLAELQSSGTWVALASETDLIRQRHAARVLRTWRIPDDDLEVHPPAGETAWGIEIAYPARNMGGQLPLMLANVYGECASWRNLRLVDLRLPASFVGSVTGPRLGIAGIRDRLGAHGRPLLVSILKPSIGLSPRQSAELFFQAAIGGSDGVKDDEKLVSQPWSDFRDRVRAHAQAANQAEVETGARTLYFVNVTDRPDRLLDNARAAVEAGASALLVNGWTVGLSSLEALAADPDVDIPIMSHLAFAGAVSNGPWSGIGPGLAMGLLPRLGGADVAVYPSHLGSLPFSRAAALSVHQALGEPLPDVRATLPLAGGGLHAGLVPTLVADLGIDWALAAGGAVHGHPMGTTAGARSIRQALDAAVRGQPLDEARKEHPELSAALERWPQPVPKERVAEERVQ